MKIAPVAEIKAKFSAYLKESQNGPVVVTKNGKPIAAILAITDEQQLMRLLMGYGPKFQVDLGRIPESQGLSVALELLKEETMATTPIAIHLEIDNAIEKLLSQLAQEVLLSLVVEAVANASKHAQADNLYLRLYQHGLQVVVEVEDDGAGFEVAKTEADHSEARLYQEQRAAMVNGKTAIQSAPGKGTKVTLSIPIDGEPTTIET